MALTLPSMPSALLSSVLSAESLAKNLQVHLHLSLYYAHLIVLFVLLISFLIFHPPPLLLEFNNWDAKMPPFILHEK
jgi:hypothetical protein